MALTDVKLRSLKPRDMPFKVSDSDALHVLVNPGGSKLWRFAYQALIIGRIGPAMRPRLAAPV